MMGDVVSLDARRAIVVNGHVTYGYSVGGGGNVLHLLLGLKKAACGLVVHRRMKALGTYGPTDGVLADPFLCDRCKAALRREMGLA